MLENNYLASNIIYLSIAHDRRQINKYLDVLEKIFRELKKMEKNKQIFDLGWSFKSSF